MKTMYEQYVANSVVCSEIVSRICRRYRSRNKSKPVSFWKDIPMKEKSLLQQGIHAPLDLGPIIDPEDRIQRKEAVLKQNFCEYVQKMHQDKNASFLTEYQVSMCLTLRCAQLAVGGYGHCKVLHHDFTEIVHMGTNADNRMYLNKYSRKTIVDAVRLTAVVQCSTPPNYVSCLPPTVQMCS